MRFDYHPHNSHLRHAPSLNLLVYDKTVETLSQDNLIVQDYFGGYVETLKDTNNCYITGLCRCWFCIHEFYFYFQLYWNDVWLFCELKILGLRQNHLRNVFI